jgi:SAM-dependent methyltransferase
MSRDAIATLPTSLRREYVDAFYNREVGALPNNIRVLDLGGNKTGKRGSFNIHDYNLQVIYANLVTTKHPDVQVMAEQLPFGADTFQAIICSELLEHVPNPYQVLNEAYRVLEPSGCLLICVPFLFRIHGDPYDYGRYTDYYWRQNLKQIGFRNIEIQKQGLFWTVLVDMIRIHVYQMVQEGQPRMKFLQHSLANLIDWARKQALTRDSQQHMIDHPLYSSFTTGFGIRCIK